MSFSGRLEPLQSSSDGRSLKAGFGFDFSVSGGFGWAEQLRLSKRVAKINRRSLVTTCGFAPSPAPGYPKRHRSGQDQTPESSVKGSQGSEGATEQEGRHHSQTRERLRLLLMRLTSDEVFFGEVGRSVHDSSGHNCCERTWSEMMQSVLHAEGDHQEKGYRDINRAQGGERKEKGQPMKS